MANSYNFCNNCGRTLPVSVSITNGIIAFKNTKRVKYLMIRKECFRYIDFMRGVR